MIKILQLHFNTPLHIHSERADYAETVTRLHSDVIWAALMQIKAFFQLNDTLFDLETGATTCRISSAFPFTEVSDKKVYFLPRPFKQFDRNNQNEGFWDKKEKALKAIEWIESALFVTHLSNPKGLQINDIKWLQEEYLCAETIKPFVFSQIDPRVRISRTGGDSEPYYVERMTFKEGSGLYVIFNGNEKAWSIFKNYMEILGGEGIGTDRNLGNGFFSISEENNETNLNKFSSLFEIESEFATNLSLYNPMNKDELNTALNSENAGYQLIKRGGWVTSNEYNTYRKRAAYFFQEGGVFNINAKEKGYEMGKTVKLTPDIIKNHDIWRIGKSLFVPIKMEN